MAFTQTDLNALNQAIGSGVMQVQYADKNVRYRSLDEMMRVRAVMMAELNQLTAPRRKFPVFSKGF